MGQLDSTVATALQGPLAFLRQGSCSYTVPKVYNGRCRTKCGRRRSIASVSYQTQRASSSDRLPIFKMLLEEKMNPLSILVPMENFMVVKGNDGKVLGAAQLKPLRAPGDECFELSSVVVQRACRGQGIGTRVVQDVLTSAPNSSRIFLVTVEDREKFYADRFGFRVVRENIPEALRLEVIVGSLVARAVTGLGLIVMSLDTTAAR